MARPFFDLTNHPCSLRLVVDELENGVGFGGSGNDHHADTHVKHLIKLLFAHTALFSKQLKNREGLPRVLPDDNIAVARKDSRNVVDKSTPGDMRQTFDSAR